MGKQDEFEIVGLVGTLKELVKVEQVGRLKRSLPGRHLDLLLDMSQNAIT